MKELLLVNANVNRKSSRTQRLTKVFLRELAKREEFHTTELLLESMHLAPLSSSSLNRRYALIEAGDTEADEFVLARQWRDADIIVISTPLWLFTYPARLKAYLEAVDVIGVAYDFNEDGSTTSYCHAQDLYYITTAGGPLAFGPAGESPFARPDGELNLGFKTIEAFAGVECHVPNVRCIAVENLDIVPDAGPGIISRAIDALPALMDSWEQD